MNVVIVGRGLIGSAAARHLSKMGHAVTLIGPSEPRDYSQHPGVFGSHYDEGRIARTLEPHPYWMQLNRASISRYGEIAGESGVDFYRNVGVFHVGPTSSTEVETLIRIAEAAGVPYELLSGENLAMRFPYLRSTSGMRGIFEPRDAGYISPRRLVNAQTVAAQRNGARIVDDTVVRLKEHVSGVTIDTSSESLEAERVLVTSGGHTASLLGRSFGFKVFGRTVAMFRVGEGEARRLAGMPSMRCFGPKGHDPYILPPIRYPDGNMWLKLGTDPVDVELEKESDIKNWFRSGGSVNVADRLQEQLLDRIRDLKFEARHVVPCMTTFGESGLPKIEAVSDRVAVAFGCYGKSAKCSDEMGRLGAVAVLGGDEKAAAV